ncbi:MAG TPA: DUF937 domain-containing protein [Haliscomenobacter sp.]|uniref:DUF937 domain-containing protein n=1 Tax=Haliscomenobacter sp. TaxID=2717303 RepID=UPI002BFF9C40|nr:DUF937 domain-containing protein [Haliscomenobacter sp.]HOY16546.1 DUF937 domain-containing protein [Haliscomenobacter sp.]
MSNQFADILGQYLNDDNFIDNLSQQIGGAEREQTRTAANGIVTAMSSAISKTATTEQGASGLLGMLDADKDGSIIDDVMNMVSGGNNGAGQAGLMQNGAGIVNSLLGGKQGGIIEMISRMSGLSGDKTGNLMSMLAPIILSALSKSGQQQGGGGFDIGSILNMLQGTQTQQKASGNPAMDMIGKFLDKDGDGDFTDDLLGGLGGLFGGKK